MHKLIKVDKSGKKYIVNVPDWNDCVSLDGVGSVESGSYDHLPFIINQPVSVSTGSGAKVQFSVNAAPAGPFDSMTYQWESGSGDILVDSVVYTGSTSRVLTITNATAGAANDYMVVVSNPYGYVTSSIASLTIV